MVSKVSMFSIVPENVIALIQISDHKFFRAHINLCHRHIIQAMKLILYCRRPQKYSTNHDSKLWHHCTNLDEQSHNGLLNQCLQSFGYLIQR